MLLGATWCYLELLGVTWCYLVSLGVTWCYSVLVGVTWCVKSSPKQCCVLGLPRTGLGWSCGPLVGLLGASRGPLGTLKNRLVSIGFELGPHWVRAGSRTHWKKCENHCKTHIKTTKTGSVTSRPPLVNPLGKPPVRAVAMSTTVRTLRRALRHLPFAGDKIDFSLSPL